jgi:transcriptional regulator with XRE-family HTH domain
MEFHQNLKRLREKAGLTQEELAEELAVTRQSVSKWELGINEPDLPTIRALCRILNCSYDELLDEERVAEQEEAGEPEEPTTPVQQTPKYRVYVAELVCTIIYLLVSLVFAFFPYIYFPNGLRVNFFLIAFRGTSNMNIVALFSLFVWVAIVTMMALLTFLRRRNVALFRARDALLIANVALMVYSLCFGLMSSAADFGLFGLFFINALFMVLHFAIPSLRAKGFAESYEDDLLSHTPIDSYVLPATLMMALAVFSLIHTVVKDPTWLVVLYWACSLLGFIALITFAILFLTLPKEKSRKGVKIGSLVSIGVILAFSLFLDGINIFPLVLFYWLDVIGVFVSVCLIKTRKKAN